jgi:hypothetical protein
MAPGDSHTHEALTRLGLSLGFYSGIGGNIANGSTGVSIGPEFAFPLGPLRWHVLAAFDSLNGYHGARLEFLTFGVPITLPVTLPSQMKIEVEPLIDLFGTEWLAGGDGFQTFGSMMLAAQANLVMKRFFVSVIPFGLEIREFTFQGDSKTAGIDGTVGTNYVFRASGGVQF